MTPCPHRARVLAGAFFLVACGAAPAPALTRASSEPTSRFLDARIENLTTYTITRAEVRVDDASPVAIDDLSLVRPLAPGAHRVGIVASIGGSGYGVFDYLRAYSFAVPGETTIEATGDRIPGDPSLFTGCVVDVVGQLVERSTCDRPVLEVAAVETCHDYAFEIASSPSACPSAAGRVSAYSATLVSLADSMLDVLFGAWARRATTRVSARSDHAASQATRALLVQPNTEAAVMEDTCRAGISGVTVVGS